VFPHFVLDRGKPGTLVLISHGRRFLTRRALSSIRAGEAGPRPLAIRLSYRRCCASAQIRFRHGAPWWLGNAGALADGYLTAGGHIDSLPGLNIDPVNLRERSTENDTRTAGRDPNSPGEVPCINHNGRRVAGGRQSEPRPYQKAPFYALRALSFRYLHLAGL